MSKENIVILGGGGAGAAIARELSAKLPKVSSKYNLILVTSRDHYVHMPAMLRMAASSEDKLEDTAVIPYDHLFVDGFGTLKIGTATRVESSSAGGTVVLQSGEEIAYRYLVVATGSIWEGPLANIAESTEEFLTSIRDWRAKFQKAQSIVIIGAGAVGLELAGELRDFFPSKKISIVQAEALPLNGVYPDSFRKDVEKRWRARDIDFIFNDRVDQLPQDMSGTATTSKGKTVTADLFVPTRGGRPNTAILSSLGENTLDEHGFVRITPTLQLAQHSDIFAAGDILSFEEQKTLAKIPGHVAVVVANILSLISGSEPKKTYSGTFEAIFITNGKTKGAGYLAKLWGLTFGDKVVPMAKGKALFVPQARKALGLTA